MYVLSTASQIARFMWTAWGPPGSCRPHVGPILAPWTLLSEFPCSWFTWYPTLLDGVNRHGMLLKTMGLPQVSGLDTSQGIRAPSQYPKRRLSVRSRKVSKPRDLYLELSYRYDIWQALHECQVEIFPVHSSFVSHLSYVNMKKWKHPLYDDHIHVLFGDYSDALRLQSSVVSQLARMWHSQVHLFSYDFLT